MADVRDEKRPFNVEPSHPLELEDKKMTKVEDKKRTFAQAVEPGEKMWKEITSEETRKRDANTKRRRKFDLQDGKYSLCVKSAKAEVIGNGYVSFGFEFIVKDGDNKTSILSALLMLNYRSDLQLLSQTLQRMGYDPSKYDLADLEWIANDLTSRQFSVLANVWNSQKWRLDTHLEQILASVRANEDEDQGEK